MVLRQMLHGVCGRRHYVEPHTPLHSPWLSRLLDGNSLEVDTWTGHNINTIEGL